MSYYQQHRDRRGGRPCKTQAVSQPFAGPVLRSQEQCDDATSRTLGTWHLTMEAMQPETRASSTDVYCRFCGGVRCRCNVEGSTPGRIRLACGYASIFSSRDGPAPLWHEQCLDCFRLWRLIFLRCLEPKCKQDPPRFQLACIKFIHKRRKRGWPCLQGVSTSPELFPNCFFKLHLRLACPWVDLVKHVISALHWKKDFRY